MTVLVTAASRHGSTAQIADAIARALRDAGVDAQVRVPSEVSGLDGYEAAVVGSAVYAGRWLEDARHLVERHAAALASMPVWLFSSGPVGDPPKPDEDPVDVADISAMTGALEHRLFAGRLDRSDLRFAERAIVMALRAPEGDFRDWNAIDAWARHICRVLTAEVERTARP